MPPPPYTHIHTHTHTHTHAHTGKLHIIVEYCSHGNLLYYLRSKRKDPQNPLCTWQLVEMARQIAKGMEHLASKNVHSMLNRHGATMIKSSIGLHMAD